LFVSCVTEKRCNNKFPPQIKTEYIEKVKDSIIYKYIDVPVYIKGDTVYQTDTVYISPNGLINSKPVYAETDFAKAMAKVFNSRLYLYLYQKDTTFNQRYDSVIKEAWHYKQLSEKKQIVKEVKYIPGFYKFMTVVGIALSLLFIGLILFSFGAIRNL
jgi:hypothetical protein